MPSMLEINDDRMLRASDLDCLRGRDYATDGNKLYWRLSPEYFRLVVGLELPTHA